MLAFHHHWQGPSKLASPFSKTVFSSYEYHSILLQCLVHRVGFHHSTFAASSHDNLLFDFCNLFLILCILTYMSISRGLSLYFHLVSTSASSRHTTAGAPLTDPRVMQLTRPDPRLKQGTPPTTPLTQVHLQPAPCTLCSSSHSNCSWLEDSQFHPQVCYLMSHASCHSLEAETVNHHLS